MTDMLDELRPDSGTPPFGERDVVFAFAYMTWREVRARGAFMAQDRFSARLLDDPRVGRLLIADQMRSTPVRVARALLGGGAHDFPADERHHLVQPGRLRRQDPVRLAAVARSVARYDRALERAAQRHGLRRPAVITTHPVLAGFGAFAWANAVTWYATDDWASHPGYRRWWPAYRRSYELVRERRRRVCGVSQGVLDAVQPTGPAIVVPNGLEPEQWAAPGPAPALVAEQRRPVLLYVGTLDSRLDADAVLATARAMPDATVLLVGPSGEPQALRALRAQPNVVVQPPLPHPEIPALVHAADVCLLPHRSTPLTRAMSPLKLYEYLAAGRPVAATDLPPVRGVDDRVVLAPSSREFPAAVRRALEIGPAGEAERRAFVTRNSWAARHDAVLEFALR